MKQDASDDPLHFARLVRDERLRLHVASTRGVVLATVGISTLVAFSFRDAVGPRGLLLGWWGGFQLLMLARLLISERWTRDPGRVERGARWERRMTAVVALSALMWGLTGTLLYPLPESGLRPVCTVIQMGVAAAAATSLSSMPNAYRAFFLTMMMPNVVWLGLQPSSAEHLTALALFLFTLLLILNGQRVYARIEQTIRLQLELARAIRQTEAALAAAREASEAKSLFVANISHELRTPMHAILGFAQLGRERAVEPKLQDYFDRIGGSGRRLLALIDDLLDLSKLEAGRMTLRPQPIALRPLVDSAAHEFEPLLRNRGLHLVVDEEDKLPPVMVDPQRMGQVIRNLLSNAVKFSPHGGSIFVRIKRNHAGREVGWVRLIVSDEGVGIPENELERVFDKFVQSSKTRTGAGGTGLGLAICRELVHAHHGAIHAHNAPTGGAVLVVELPPAPAQARAIERPAA